MSEKLSLNEKRLKKLRARMSEAICGTDAVIKRNELARLTKLKPPFRRVDRLPVLTLGTIISKSTAEGEDPPKTEYLLCIQPTCDSVRLNRPTHFPFLALREVEKEFSIIVDDIDGKPVYLRVIPKTKEIKLYEFAPNPIESGVVRAQTTQDGAVYYGTDRTVYKYIAELKDGYAQRVVQQFGAHISRVGLNEMEWLRLIEANEWS